MLGSNFSAANLGLSSSARCSPNRLHAVYSKTIELTEEGRRQLLASDQVLECLMYVKCGSDELFRKHGASVNQFNTGRPPLLDNDAYIDLWLDSAVMRL